MNKQYDVVVICNALIDILVEASDGDLEALKLRKGAMHLVDQETQLNVLGHFPHARQKIELGGSGMNALRSLAALGLRTYFAGMVGRDDMGRRIEDRMHELGISGSLGHSDEGTGTCAVLITPDHERTMNTNLGASRLYDASLVPREALESTRLFHFCGYQWDTPGQKEAIHTAMKTAKEAGALISFDVADPFVVERNKDEFPEIIAEFADVVFANKEEAQLLYGADPVTTGKRIAETGAIAAIKLGAEGAVICKDRETYPVAPVAANVLDTTAAGDMFAAGFLFGFLQGLPLGDCGVVAATLASDVISRIGATVGQETFQGIRERYQGEGSAGRS